MYKHSTTMISNLFLGMLYKQKTKIKKLFLFIFFFFLKDNRAEVREDKSRLNCAIVNSRLIFV